ncbi:MAG TPA: NAD+ synthase [Candidatus Acidoferrales bacterium]|jgi:NAD+ synthase/NAD+ synthase (glutamine-hydrolysing)|nr:NAD+ synthase [Candidatus Acidoferrales bacterium]
MKIALAQFNPTVGDFEGNSARILELARQARAGGAELAVFSELCLCGYPPQDLIERPAFIRRNHDYLERLCRGIVLPSIIGYVGKAHEEPGKRVANLAALIGDGKILFEQQKMLLPTYDVFDETRYFQPALTQHAFLLDGETLGVTICEDIWNDKTFWTQRLYARDPVTELVGKGSSIILNISSSPYTIDKRAIRQDMLRAMAKRHQLPVVYVNQVGGNDSLVFDGSSVAFLPDGNVAALAKSFEEDLVFFDSASGTGDVRPQISDEIEAAYQALVLGTGDYVRKCGFRKVVIGLSGGVDSALVATIAADALGPENVTGVSMPGPFSSEGSVSDAKCLSKNLGIKLLTLPIGDTFESYRRALAGIFAGMSPDVTEENLQARIRGNLLMAFSNKFGALVLSTGNKSEMAVGYCTLYGDMAGGLAVISDVPKTMVYELAKYANRSAHRIPGAIFTKPPSAELRPNQTDQDSLPPYDVLDRILKSYVEDLHSPEEIAQHYDFALELVQSVARQVDRNEYKRKQAPPGLKITSKAFSVGRRFPLAQKFSV